MAGYATLSWQNNDSPPINAANLTALGEAVEIAEHPYGVCSTAAATAAKTVSIDFSGTLALFTGLTVRVKFTYANTAASPTLNVNGTGAAAIIFSGAAVGNGAWMAGEVMEFLYDGTSWNMSKSPVDSAPTSGSSSLITSGGVFDAIEALGVGASTAAYHNGIYRGNSLGSSVTPEQQAAIAAGTFDDMFIGDYWTISSTAWRIAHFDYWLDATSGSQLPHHVVLVRNLPRTGAKMNNTATTTGGYLGSDFYTGANSNTARADMIAEVESAFGANNILSHTEYFSSTVTNGQASATTSAASRVDLMNEYMVYGAPVWGMTPYEAETDWQQLAIFNLSRERAVYRSRSYWLRTVASATQFAMVGYNQRATYDSASATNRGIRPVFAIQYG